MLFESFHITLTYRQAPAELEIRECYHNHGSRVFEVIQGGIGIIVLTLADGKWNMCVADDVHPVVKQDTERFVSHELVELLISAIIKHYDCFSQRKIKKKEVIHVRKNHIWKQYRDC